MRRGIAALRAFGLVACGSAGAGATVDTNAVQKFVQDEIPSSVTSVAGAPSDEAVDVTSNACVQASGVTWNCTVEYSVSSASDASVDQKYSATLNVTCDSTGSCSFPAFTGTPIK